MSTSSGCLGKLSDSHTGYRNIPQNWLPLLATFAPDFRHEGSLPEPESGMNRLLLSTLIRESFGCVFVEATL